MNTVRDKVEPKVYNVPQIASFLDINLIAAYELVKKENLAIRIGRRLVVPRERFHQWLETAGSETHVSKDIFSQV